MHDWKKQDALILVLIFYMHSLRCRITNPHMFRREASASNAIPLVGEANSNPIVGEYKALI